jgi:hypothetical protein
MPDDGGPDRESEPAVVGKISLSEFGTGITVTSAAPGFLRMIGVRLLWLIVSGVLVALSILAIVALPDSWQAGTVALVFLPGTAVVVSIGKLIQSIFRFFWEVAWTLVSDSSNKTFRIEWRGRVSRNEASLKFDQIRGIWFEPRGTDDKEYVIGLELHGDDRSIVIDGYLTEPEFDLVRRTLERNLATEAVLKPNWEIAEDTTDGLLVVVFSRREGFDLHGKVYLDFQKKVLLADCGDSAKKPIEMEDISVVWYRLEDRSSFGPADWAVGFNVGKSEKSMVNVGRAATDHYKNSMKDLATLIGGRMNIEVKEFPKYVTEG